MIQEWFKNLKEILKTDKYIFTNLLIRIVLVCIAIIFHHWQDGDTNHYLMASNSVCHGEWGGEPGRVPFYYWFVALTSFCRVYRFGINSWGGGVESTLIVQTFLVFFVGIFIYKKFNKKLSYLWLFDPVILIYSNLIMSDLFFAIAVFGMTYFFYLELTQPKTNSKSLIYFSIFSGVTLLSRPIGIPLIYVSLLILIIFALKKIFSFKKILICASIILALITPRLLWNLKYHNSLFLAAQGGEWSKTIVAAVEYHHEGISFTDAEVKWFKLHPNATTTELASVLIHKFPTFFLLTFKGVLRVLFGHVNIEWIHFFTGKSVLGPAWFKVAEIHSDQPQISSSSLLPWTLGVLFVFLWCLYIYVELFKNFVNSGIKLQIKDPFFIWCIAIILVLAITPQLFGNARFRLPILSVVILLLGHFQNKKTVSKE